jgi:hypothetical protein
VNLTLLAANRFRRAEVDARRFAARARLIASIESITPAGAPIVPARQWTSVTCCGCSRAALRTAMSTLRWADATGSEVQTRVCDACERHIDALISTWTQIGPFGARVVTFGPKTSLIDTPAGGGVA